MESYYDKCMKDIYDEGMEEGAEQSKIEIAMNLMALGTVSIDDIAKATGLSVEKITELAGAKAS